MFNEAGFVHRDISMGNLLLCKTKDGGHVCKLSDLEYSREQMIPGAVQDQSITVSTRPCYSAVNMTHGLGLRERIASCPPKFRLSVTGLLRISHGSNDRLD